MSTLRAIPGKQIPSNCEECGAELFAKRRQPCKDGLYRCKTCAYKEACRLDRVLDLQKLGMTWEAYQALLKDQNNACAICRTPFGLKTPDIDHDHETGKVRGLLCRACNLLLGHFQDNFGALGAAVAYLRRSGNRTSWDRYFLDIAEIVASRSKDRSRQVGSVLVRDRQVLATGFNGFPSGVNDDLPERHERPKKYMWTVHSELNALLQAGKHGINTADTTLYVTPLSPCLGCAKAAVQAGVKEIVCPEPGLLGTGDASAEQGQALELLQAARVIVRRPE